MLQSPPHVFSHQQQPYGQQSDQSGVWSPQNQPAQHQSLGLGQVQQQHVQVQAQAAAAAAAVQAQQQRYGNSNNANSSNSSSNQRAGPNQNHAATNNRSINSHDPLSASTANNSGGSNGINGGGTDTANSGMEQGITEENRKVLQWVAELMDPATREGALMELSKKREQVPELALVIWHSFGVMTSLLQEIISVYPLLNPSQLTAAASNRVCNALALLQCVASHNETRSLFLHGESCIVGHVKEKPGVRSEPLLTLSFMGECSTRSTLPISFPQHNIQISALRIPPLDISGRDWRPGQE